MSRRVTAILSFSGRLFNAFHSICLSCSSTTSRYGSRRVSPAGAGGVSQRQNTFCHCETPPAPAGETRRDPYRDVVEEQERQMLWKALNSLPEKERIAVTLRDIEGLSTSEVAAILETSESTVRSQISRARVRMKDAIDEMLGGRQ